MAPINKGANTALEPKPYSLFPTSTSFGTMELITVAYSSVACLWIATLLYCACCKGDKSKKEDEKSPLPSPCSPGQESLRPSEEIQDGSYHHHRYQRRDEPPPDSSVPGGHHHRPTSPGHGRHRRRREHRHRSLRQGADDQRSGRGDGLHLHREPVEVHGRHEKTKSERRQLENNRPRAPPSAVKGEEAKSKHHTEQKRLENELKFSQVIQERKPPSYMAPYASHNDPTYQSLADVEEVFQGGASTKSYYDRPKPGHRGRK